MSERDCRECGKPIMVPPYDRAWHYSCCPVATGKLPSPKLPCIPNTISSGRGKTARKVVACAACHYGWPKGEQ